MAQHQLPAGYAEDPGLLKRSTAREVRSAAVLPVRLRRLRHNTSVADEADWDLAAFRLDGLAQEVGRVWPTWVTGLRLGGAEAGALAADGRDQLDGILGD